MGKEKNWMISVRGLRFLYGDLVW